MRRHRVGLGVGGGRSPGVATRRTRKGAGGNELENETRWRVPGGQSSTQEALEGRGQGRGPGRRGTAGGPEGRGLRPWAWPGWVGVQPPGQTHPVGGRGPGLLLLIALTGYTAKNAWKDDVFFSWSYFSGWLALPFSILAGNLDSGGGWRRLPRGPLPSLQRPPPSLLKTPQRLPSTLHSRLSRGPGRNAPRAPNPSPRGPPGHSPQNPPFLHPPSVPVPLPLGFCFLLADMILQSTDAISGFPVCL